MAVVNGGVTSGHRAVRAAKFVKGHATNSRGTKMARVSSQLGNLIMRTCSQAHHTQSHQSLATDGLAAAVVEADLLAWCVQGSVPQMRSRNR